MTDDRDDRSNEPLGGSIDRSKAPEVERVTTPWWRVPVSPLRIVGALVGALALYYVITLAQVVDAGRSHTADPADAIVVLGAAQYDGRPSPQLAARLDHAVTLWNDGVTNVILVTGGKLPDDRFTEAEASRRYLVEQGIPESVIMMEDAGRTTTESLGAAAALLLDAGLDQVVLVSDPYHMKRADMVADRFGLDASTSATPTSVVTGWTSVRRHAEEAAGVALGRVIGFDRLSDLAG